MDWSTAVIAVLAAYLAIGVLVGGGFVCFGVSRFDHGAAGAPIGFRMLILPGCCALWPVVLRWWIAGSGSVGGRS